MSLSEQACRALPKIALHDHLDGGLRPSTVIELAADAGHELPTTDPTALADWFYEAADSGSLVRYLETFVHTVAVMQTPAALRRVAREFVEDQAADGVIHAEARWAPEQHLRVGLSMAEAIEAVRDGLAEGVASAAAAGRSISATQLITAMRHAQNPTTEVAGLAVTYRDDSVAGFDLAGAEAGFPPGRFADSCDLLVHNGVPITIHAGEAAGVESIREAVLDCGASRVGHGVRLIEDIAEDGTLGPVAQHLHDHRIPLEISPSSNLQTGIAERIEDHPFARLAERGFAVTINCDNRLMSRTTMSREYALLSQAFGYTADELLRFTLTAAQAAFLPADQRGRLVERVREGFAASAG